MSPQHVTGLRQHVGWRGQDGRCWQVNDIQPCVRYTLRRRRDAPLDGDMAQTSTIITAFVSQLGLRGQLDYEVQLGMSTGYRTSYGVGLAADLNDGEVIGRRIGHPHFQEGGSGALARQSLVKHLALECSSLAFQSRLVVTIELKRFPRTRKCRMASVCRPGLQLRGEGCVQCRGKDGVAEEQDGVREGCLEQEVAR